LIALEGLDGSGKSTLSRELIRHYGVEKLDKRPDFFRKTLRTMRVGKASPHDLHAAFLMTLGYASNLYAMQSFSKPQLVETWLAGEIHAYHLYAKACGLEPYHFDYAALPIVQPDHIVYLKPDYETRVMRLFHRNKQGLLDDFDERTKDPSVESSFQKTMTDVYQNYHVVDTALPAVQTARQIAERLGL
jgi:thymidylate kinase